MTAVECYGTALTHCKYDKLFLPVQTSDSMLFGRFIAEFHAPIVTTASLESALISLGEGYVVELVEYDSRLTCFSLAPLRKHVAREQVLFCGGALPLRLVNVRHVARAQPTQYLRFVSALSALDTQISGQRPSEAPSKADLAMMLMIVKREDEQLGLGEYVQNLFEYFVIYVKRVCIDFYWLCEYYAEMQGVLVAEDKQSTVLIDNVLRFFPNCERIEVQNGHEGVEASEAYLAGLLEALGGLKLDEVELKVVELKNAHFESQVVFGKFMEPFFNAGFDVSIEKNKFEKSLLFKVVEQ